MARAKISIEQKKIIINLYDKGELLSDIEKALNINESSVRVFVFRYKKNKAITQPRGHRRKIINEIHESRIIELIEEECQLTLEEISEKIEDEFGIKVSISTVHRCLHDLHFSFKRIVPVPERRNTSSTIENRYQYDLQFNALRAEMDRVFFLDETGVQIHARTDYGQT